MRLPSVIAVDTNIFIYQFSRHPEFSPFTVKIFHQLELQRSKGVTSIATLIELLSEKNSSESTEQLKELFLNTPQLSIFDINQEIGEEAARIRRTYKYKLADSIQLATAISAKADVFITNDKQLTSCKDIRVALLQEL